MRNETRDLLPGRMKLRRLRRPLMSAAPVAVWIMAIALALHLHRGIGFGGAITGFADDRLVTLAHPEPAVVRDVHVQLYDEVTRGQVLVSLDDRKERIELAAVQEDVERLRAEVLAAQATLSTGDARATADVEDLERRFAVDREAAHLSYLTQLAADAYDRIELHGAKAEYEIVRSLRDQGSAHFRELNDIETEAKSLQAKVDENTQILSRMKTAFEKADARWFQFTEREDVATVYEPVLTPLRLAIDVRRRDLEEILRRIDSHVLRAPVDGQVTRLLADAGDHVQPGAALVMVSPRTTSRVVAYLPEHMILSARVGTPVRVNCLAIDGGGRREYPGQIVSLSATVDEAPPRYRQSPTYPIWGRGLVAALVDNVHLIPGEAVTLSFPDRH